MVLVDATGKSLPACHVFKIFIEAFVNYTMQIINREKRLEKGHWMWTLVVNVTAYLRHTGEQFLRSCAEQAGISSDQLIFVTEAEAAFMSCHQDHFHELKDGAECMIVHLEEYKDAHKVKEIVMVGDFSECSLVQNAVRQTFSNRNITIPTDSGLAVMKGAVTCGNQPYRYKQISSSEVRK
ncbi:unnamed protein product [Mytilus edulis]|uniref:Uncharacterized protein n=1 Tax=Mytilus edulis TaxID=6550 RepID=A0A8S3U910_MYTED|nr:unnamed protein product [Mytilus edulis]